MLTNSARTSHAYRPGGVGCHRQSCGHGLNPTRTAAYQQLAWCSLMCLLDVLTSIHCINIYRVNITLLKYNMPISIHICVCCIYSLLLRQRQRQRLPGLYEDRAPASQSCPGMLPVTTVLTAVSYNCALVAVTVLLQNWQVHSRRYL
jgi:hypothetical protein